MFTGIITDIGTVRSAEPRGDLRLTIVCGYDMTTIDIGASLACSGACLTVVDKGENWFAVDVSAETQARTPPDMWREGAKLNLERALRVGDELGGHIVTGHVDGVGQVVSVTPEGLIEVRGNGTDSVLATHAGKTFPVPVTVRFQIRRRAVGRS